MLRAIFVLGIFLPGVAAACVNRFAGLLLYLWFALFRPQEWLWWDTSQWRLSLVVGLVLVVPSLLTGIMPSIAHPICISMTLFFAGGLLGQMDAFAPAIGWNWLDYLARLLLVSFLAVSLISDQKRFKLTMAVVAGSLGFHAARAGLASLLGGGVRLFDGLAGAFVDNNGYAVAMGMVTPLLVAVSQNAPRRWIARCFAVAALLTVFGLLSTFSRGGFLAALAGSLTWIALQKKRWQSFVLVTCLAIPVGVFMSAQEGYSDRLQTIVSYEEANEESALGRIHFWAVALKMAVDHPLGIGFFNYEQAYDRYDTSMGRYGSKRSVHSSHLQALVEAGFLGFVAFEGALICSCICAFRIRRRGFNTEIAPEDARLFLTMGNALITSIATFAIGGAFVAMALNDLTWLICALVAALDRISFEVCDRAGVGAALTKPEIHRRAIVSWRPVTRPEAV